MRPFLLMMVYAMKIVSSSHDHKNKLDEICKSNIDCETSAGKFRCGRPKDISKFKITDADKGELLKIDPKMTDKQFELIKKDPSKLKA